MQSETVSVTAELLVGVLLARVTEGAEGAVEAPRRHEKGRPPRGDRPYKSGLPGEGVLRLPLLINAR